MATETKKISSSSSSSSRKGQNRLGSVVWRQPGEDEDNETFEFAAAASAVGMPSSSSTRSSLMTSRRLYYHNATDRNDNNADFVSKSIKQVQARQSQRAAAASAKQTDDDNNKNGAFLSTEQLTQLDNLYDADDSKELDEYYDFDSTGQIQAEEFLAQQQNIEILQKDLAAAEALFFEQHPLEDIMTSTSAAATATQFPIQLFHFLRYNNVEHRWHQKPFQIQHMMVFFGNVPPERMERITHEAQAEICRHMPQRWDPESLVLCNVGRLFGAKLYISIQTNNISKDETSLDNNNNNNKPNRKVEYLTGTWLSKVYVGNQDDHFHEWVDETIAYVADNYDGLQVHPHDGKSHWFVWYPDKLHADESTLAEGESVVVFFVQVSSSS